MPRLGPHRQVFGSSNEYGIPDLLVPFVAHQPPKQMECIGYHSLRGLRGKSICHYTDDFRFQGAWTRPRTYRQAIIDSECESIIEPDFSCYTSAPLVEQMHAVYRSRWCARYWQDEGVRVIPSLTWSTRESVEWSLAGIPRGVIVACETRHITQRIEGFRYMLLRCLHIVEPSLLVTYGAPITFPLPCAQKNFPAFNPRLRMKKQPKQDSL